MSILICLGAINVKTNEYCVPICGNKKDKYKCPECNKTVIFRCGKIRRKHFSHINHDNMCKYFEHIGESQIHQYGKELFKYLLQNKIVKIKQECTKCGKNMIHVIDTIEKNIKLEYHFMMDTLSKIADVAIVDKNNEISYIFEILNTHHTQEHTRPEPWFEVDVQQLMNINSECDEITLICRRKFICENCENNVFPRDLLHGNYECHMPFNPIEQELTSDEEFTMNLWICANHSD